MISGADFYLARDSDEFMWRPCFDPCARVRGLVSANAGCLLRRPVFFSASIWLIGGFVSCLSADVVDCRRV